MSVQTAPRLEDAPTRTAPHTCPRTAPASRPDLITEDAGRPTPDGDRARMPAPVLSATQRSAPRTGDTLAARALRLDHALTALAGIGGGVSLGLTALAFWPTTASLTDLLALGEALAATAGTWIALLVIVLAARVPALERAFGHDRLLAAHRTLAPWALWLVTAHVVGVVAQRSLLTDTDPLAATWRMVTTEPWVGAGLVVLVLLAAVGLSSWRRLRRRLKYGTWWTIHLYSCVAIALAFLHQVNAGGPFTSGFGRVWWSAATGAALATLVMWRIALPLWRDHRTEARVHAVIDEATGVSSVWLSGSFAHLRVRPGQFINVRFVSDGLLWESHPYSLSAPVQQGRALGGRDLMRVTVKALGDASTLTRRVAPGTRVHLEGPYGALTADRCVTGRALLVGAGVGTTPLRALGEELLDEGVEVTTLARFRNREDVLFAEEWRRLQARGMGVHLLTGTRTDHPLDAAALAQYLPAPGACDVYVCGGADFVARVSESAAALGVPDRLIHTEAFDL